MAKKKGGYARGGRHAKSGGSRARTGSAPHRGIGFLFWLCLAAIIVAVGFAARAPLQASLTRVFGRSSGVATSPAPAPQVTITPLRGTGTQPSNAPPSRDVEPAHQPVPAPAAVRAPAAASEKPAERKMRMFFTTVDQDGRILMKSVIRSIPASDSPLRDSIETLLKGPTAQELNLGLVSMIPVDAKLRGVTVRGDTAYIDLSESFRFNAQGIEALDAQLRQLVYAATEFPSVKQVQVLIEGKKARYLGTEGVRIDEPLSRSSFPQ